MNLFKDKNMHDVSVTSNLTGMADIASHYSKVTSSVVSLNLEFEFEFVLLHELFNNNYGNIWKIYNNNFAKNIFTLVLPLIPATQFLNSNTNGENALKPARIRKSAWKSVYRIIGFTVLQYKASNAQMGTSSINT